MKRHYSRSNFVGSEISNRAPLSSRDPLLEIGFAYRLSQFDPANCHGKPGLGTHPEVGFGHDWGVGEILYNFQPIGMIILVKKPGGVASRESRPKNEGYTE